MKRNAKILKAAVAIAAAAAPAERDAIIGEDRFSDNTPGQIYFANETRFDSSHYSRALTDYTVGWKEPTDIDKIVDFIAPPVQAYRKFEFRKAENAEAYLSETDDERAIGSDFKQIEYKGTMELSKTINRGLTMRIDRDSVEGQSDWEFNILNRMLQRLKRSELRRTLQMLDASSINTNKVWNNTGNPDNDIREMVNASGDARGIDANRVLFGLSGWNLRLSSIGAQTNTAATQLYQQKPQDLADFYGVEQVEIARQRYQATATTKAAAAGLVVYGFYGLQSALADDPSDLKRFWTPCQDGLRYAVYAHPVGVKFVDLTVECYSRVIATGTVGPRKLTVAAA